MITLVCGGRKFSNRDLLKFILDDSPISCIVHGGAEGADSLAGEWAIANKIPEIIVPAQWSGFGKSAGVIRNQWMLEFIGVERVIAFPGGRGTRDMVERAQKAKIKVITVSQL